MSRIYLQHAGRFLALTPPSPPAAPSGLSATSDSSSSIAVSWSSVSGATTYTLQHSSDGVTFTDLVTQAGTTYEDTGLAAGSTWYYQVRANNAAGSSSYDGPVSATIPPASLIKSQHANGQTYIYRPELNPNTTTNRYALYRSTTGAITSLTGLTPIQTFLGFNAGQVFGGKPDTNGGQIFNATNRNDSTAQMAKLPDGTQLSTYTALAVHTCTATESAYYALVATDTSGNPVEAISSGVNSLAFAVSETALATTYPVPLVWAASTARPADPHNTLAITGTTGLPCWLQLHASAASGGAPARNTDGDYLQFFGDSSMGIQEGMQTAWDVLEYHTPNPHQIWATTRETNWKTDWTGAFESYHMGAGYVASGWASPRVKMWQHNRLLAFIAWLKSHYSIDANRLTLSGQSMGAWGAPAFGFRYHTNFACIQTTFTNFRVYTRDPQTWPVVVKNTPFGVSLTTNPLGTDPTQVFLDDGVTPWGGDGNYIDAVTLITNATADLPMFFGFLGRNDGYSNMTQFFAGLDALDAAHQPYACYWTNGNHDPTKVGIENVLLDSAGTSPGAGAGAARAWATYHAFMTQFQRNKSYPAFSNASHNDLSTDTVGGRNVGFRWGTDTGATNGSVTDTGVSWSAYIDNIYMDVTPAASWNSSTSTLNFGGPQHGPYSSITVDITPVFRQSFLPANGATVNYSYTPFGGSPTTGTVTVNSHGRFTITGVVINSSGPTLLSLS